MLMTPEWALLSVSGVWDLTYTLHKYTYNGIVVCFFMVLRFMDLGMHDMYCWYEWIYKLQDMNMNVSLCMWVGYG